MSFNKQLLINETRKARTTPPVKKTNKNVPPAFFMDPRALLPESFAQPIHPMYELGGDPPDHPLDEVIKSTILDSSATMDDNARAQALIELHRANEFEKYGSAPEGSGFYRDADTNNILDPYKYGYNKGIGKTINTISQPRLAKRFAKNNPRYVFDEGGIVQQGGWEYKQQGSEYLTRRQGNPDWITAKGKARDAIQTKVYGQSQASAPAMDPAQMIQTKQELKSYDINQTGDSDYVRNIQSKLIGAGYDLGRYGTNKDGVDGVFGNATKSALEAFNSGISPQYAPAPTRATKTHRTPKITKKTAAEVKKDLQPGILPTFSSGAGEEVCVKGKGCSYNVSVKMGNLLGNAAEGGSGSLWAEDAWFNKSDLISKGGELIYQTSDRNVNSMPKVPVDLYDKFQVGDYVQLNRKDTPSSKEFAAKTKTGLQNENVEHMGFIIGKDEDGTPLMWHGSESGKAYIQRIDETLSLPDHKSLGNYEIASVVRNKALTNNPEALRALEQSAYYSPVNEKNILVPSKNASLKQKQMAGVVNDSIKDFKALGYSQEDLTYLGQILVGGIMENETSGGESNKAYPKEVAAVLFKNVMGFGDNEASRGIYQLKPKMNLKDDDGNLNSIGQQLQKLGIDYENVAGSSEAQTKAGLLMLLDAYKDLKNDPNFDAETNMYMGKIPASYIVAKSWQAGKGWQNKDRYKDLLNELDVDYSWNALENATNTIAVADGEKSLSNELEAAKAMKEQQDRERYRAERVAYQNSAEGKKDAAEQAEKARVEAEWAKYNSPRSQFYQQPISEPTNIPARPMADFRTPGYEDGGPHAVNPETMSPRDYNAWVQAGNQITDRKAHPEGKYGAMLKEENQKAWLDYGDGKSTIMNPEWKRYLDAGDKPLDQAHIDAQRSVPIEHRDYFYTNDDPIYPEYYESELASRNYWFDHFPKKPNPTLNEYGNPIFPLGMESWFAGPEKKYITENKDIPDLPTLRTLRAQALPEKKSEQVLAPFTSYMEDAELWNPKKNKWIKKSVPKNSPQAVNTRERMLWANKNIEDSFKQRKKRKYTNEERYRFEHGGPHDKNGKPMYVGYDRLLQDWEEQQSGNTAFGNKGELFYKGYNNSIGDFSSLNPNTRKMVDPEYLENYVTQAKKSRGLYPFSGDNSYAKKAIMGQIPVRFDAEGKAQVLSDAYGGFGRKGKGRAGVDYVPVNWEEYAEDQAGGVKRQFNQPIEVTSKTKVPSWVPKGGVSTEQNRGITNLIDSYNNDQGIREAVDSKKFSSDGKLSREQAYKLLTKDPNLYKSAMDKRSKGMDQVRGITEEESQQNEYNPVNTGVALIDDLNSGVIDPIVQSAKSLWNDPGQLSYIPDAYKGYAQSNMPDYFGEMPLPGQEGYYMDDAIKGVDAAGNLLNTIPLGFPASKVAAPLLKGVGKRAGALYTKGMQSSKLAQKTLNPVWNKMASSKIPFSGKNIIGSKTHKGLTNLTKKATFDNMALIKGTLATPYMYNEYQKNPTWGNLAMTGYAATGLIPGVKYAKGALASGKRYIGDVMGASKHAGKFKVPTYKNVYRAEPTSLNQASNTKSMTGRWFADNPGDTQFYVRNLKSADPNSKVRIMRTRMPQHKIEQQFGAGMPEEARLMSAGPGINPVSEMDNILGPGASKRWTTDRLTADDKYAIENAQTLFSPVEGILDPSLVNKMRKADVTNMNPLARSRTQVFPDKKSASMHLFDLQKRFNQSGTGIGKYSPFSFRKQGGAVKGDTPIWEGLFR